MGLLKRGNKGYDAWRTGMVKQTIANARQPPSCSFGKHVVKLIDEPIFEGKPCKVFECIDCKMIMHSFD